jgi:hypothetical protein
VRDEDEEEGELLANNLAVHQAWSERNSGRPNEIAAGVRTRAKEAQRFQCDLRDYDAAT